MTLSLRPRRVRDDAASQMFPSDDESDYDEPLAQRKPAKSRRSKRSRQQYAAPSDEVVDSSEDDGDVRPAKRPIVNGRAWLPQEDAVLLAAVKKYGSSWKQIAASLQHLGTRRTTAMCRNRHQRIMAPLQEGKGGRNRCKRCGQIKRGHTCISEVAGGAPALPLALTEEGAPPTKRVKFEGAIAAASEHDALFVPDARQHGRPSQRAPSETSDCFKLPDQPLLTPSSGNAFKVDFDAFLAVVNNNRQAEEAASASDGSGRFILPPAENAPAPADAPSVGTAPDARVSSSTSTDAALSSSTSSLPAPTDFLASREPPMVGGGAISLSQRSLGSIALSAISDADLTDLVDFSELELQRTAEAALASKSFDALGARSFDGSHSNQPHPAVERETTPTTQMSDDDTLNADLPADEAALARCASDSAQKGGGAAGGGAAALQPQLLSGVAQSPPLTQAQSCSSAPPRLLRATTLATGAPEHSFDALLQETTSRPSSPIRPIPEVALANGVTTAPPLMPLPSWSRAPSFSFAETVERPTALSVAHRTSIRDLISLCQSGVYSPE